MYAVDTSMDPAANDLPFLLAEHGRHLDHGSPHRRCAVDGLLVGIERRTSSIQFGGGVCHMENAASKPIDGPHYQDIELSPHRALEPGRSTSHGVGHLLKDKSLVVGGLVVAARTGVGASALDLCDGGIATGRI